MSRLAIVALNDSILRTKSVALRQQSRSIDIGDPEDLKFAQKLIYEMLRALYADPSGAALAAPQVGVLVQIVVISYRDKETNSSRLMALINPRITLSSSEKNEDMEICLSIPNYSGNVIRASSVEVEAYNPKGELIRFAAEGWFARVIQHELDHLEGILYVDRTTGKLEHVQDFPERRAVPDIRKLGLHTNT